MKKKILLEVLMVTILLGVSAGIASATSTNMRNAAGPSSGHLFWRTVYPKEISLTIYNDMTLVKEVYEIYLSMNKIEKIWFGNFPDKVEPSSIRVKSLTDPNNRVHVLEQSFNKIYFQESLVCRVFSETWDSKTHEIELSYFVKGITWQPMYRLELDKDGKPSKFSGWVVINNQAGKPIELEAYKNAKIKLVAGDVHRVGGRFYALGEGKAPSGQFKERKFFEYHTYTLKKTATLKYDATELIPLFTRRNLGEFGVYSIEKFSKKLIFEGKHSKKVQIWLSFLNGEENGLGIPLPAGVIQVFKEDIDGQLEFIGEDRIGHTPKDEMINLYIGNAFDIVALRQVRGRKKIDDYTWEETIEIILNNHKDENVKVTVIEHLPYIDWKIIDIEIKKGFGTPKPEDKKLPRYITYYKKRDAQTIEFRPEVVPKNSRTIIIYKIRYIR